MALTFQDIGNLNSADSVDENDWIIVGSNTDGTARKIKSADYKASFAIIEGIDNITASADELNTLDGITASTDELNILDGVTADANELNLLDGAGAMVASGTQASHLSDADTSHDFNPEFDSAEVASAADALATKINTIIDALEAFGIMAGS